MWIESQKCWVAVIGLIWLACSSCVTPTKHSYAWIALFDGSNLDAWEFVAGGEWTIQDRILIGHHGRKWSTDPEKTGSYLRTREPYANFVLELDYMINRGGNSGVFIRSAAEKNPAFTGYEMQITDCAGKELSQKNSGLYDVIGFGKNTVKPAGEWNRAVIRAEGNHITIAINGENVVDYTGDRRLEGFIGLQNHDDHSVVKFRNIRVRKL